MADYACELQAGDVHVARELWSRQLVVVRVTRTALARSEAHATLHSGHAVVSVDGVSTIGMSARKFTALWETSSETHVVGFRDRKRAELEATLLHDRKAAVADTCATITQTTTLTPEALQNAIQRIQSKLWTHELQVAEEDANTLASTHPLALVAQVELAFVRVLVSNDALALTRARAVAKRSLAAIQALNALQTLSHASALSVRMALAEALLLSAALQFVAEKSVLGVTELRRCAAAYADLRDHVGLGNHPTAGSKPDLPPSLLAGLQSRLHFGLGVLQLASASAFQGVEWLGAVVGDVGRDAATALDHLIACYESESTDAAASRAAWASLALFHCFRAVRTLQQTTIGGGIGRKYTLRVAQVQRQSLLRFPNSVLHLWSASLSEFSSASLGNDDDKPRFSTLELLARALALSPPDERAHLLRFDAAYRYFIRHAFDASAPLFTAICKCTSAPSKLRGLGSVFLAAGDLLVAASSSQSEWQRLQSVRLLLRAALRFFDDARAKDAEAASLYQRITVYVASADWYLRLLPCEILYVHCSRPSFASVCKSTTHSTSTSSTSEGLSTSGGHQNALAYLNQFAIQDASVEAMGLLHSQGKVIKLNATEQRRYHSNSSSTSFSFEAQAICEWSVLRTSVLYHLGDFTAAQQQLETLQELLPRVRAGSFVHALVVYYSLQLRLQQRLARHPDSGYQEDGNALVKRTRKLESQPFEYSYLYAGKLKALTALWAKKSPGGGAFKAHTEVVKHEPLRLAASATVAPGSRVIVEPIE